MILRATFRSGATPGPPRPRVSPNKKKIPKKKNQLILPLNFVIFVVLASPIFFFNLAPPTPKS
jgi:hypothetical protein